jgi:hypothetical protein
MPPGVVTVKMSEPDPGVAGGVMLKVKAAPPTAAAHGHL